MENNDFLEALREQEWILGEKMQSGFHRWMDELLKNAYSPETMRRMAESMGIDLSQLLKKTGLVGGIDPYRVLGLEKTATDIEVKKRYRELLVILHPDTAAKKGTEYFFEELVDAYQQIGKERGW